MLSCFLFHKQDERTTPFHNSTWNSPCVADIKLGQQTWDSECDARKRRTHEDIDRASTSAQLGWRLGGVVLGNASSTPLNLGKNYGVFVPCARAIEPLLAFLTGDPWHYGCEAPTVPCPPSLQSVEAEVVGDRCRRIVARLREIEAFFALGTHTAFATSVLVAYDAQGAGRVSVVLIDYAHIWRAAECTEDSGALTGVRSLIALLSAVAEDPSAVLASHRHD